MQWRSADTPPPAGTIVDVWTVYDGPLGREEDRWCDVTRTETNWVTLMGNLLDWKDNEFGMTRHNRVTHWMERPTPPDGGTYSKETST